MKIFKIIYSIHFDKINIIYNYIIIIANNIDKIFYRLLYNIYDVPCPKIMRYDYCLI